MSRPSAESLASPLSTTALSPSLDELWMPFTANRAFKRAPRMLVAAKDMHYTTADGREILDGTAGLWCVNAGHCRESITAAIREQAGVMDYAPPFQMGHPLAFELAQRLTAHPALATRPRLLRQLRLRSGRHGAQDRAGLLAGEG